MQRTRKYGIDVIRYSMSERFTMAKRLIMTGTYTPDYTIRQLAGEK